MKEKLSCYIIDDEHLAQKILEEYVAKVSFLEWKGSFSSALEAAENIDRDKPDLLFLDINMPDLNGISFISMLNPKPMIIFTTAYDQYALKAFDLEVKDYLLKPIPFERFYKAVHRLFTEAKTSSFPDLPSNQVFQVKEPEYIFLKVGFKIRKVQISDILFVEGMKEYVRIHTHNEKIMTLLSFGKLLEILPSNKFIRVHRSFVVSIEKIDHIEKNRIRIGSFDIPVSDTYADPFFKKIGGMGE